MRGRRVVGAGAACLAIGAAMGCVPPATPAQDPADTLAERVREEERVEREQEAARLAVVTSAREEEARRGDQAGYERITQMRAADEEREARAKAEHDAFAAQISDHRAACLADHDARAERARLSQEALDAAIARKKTAQAWVSTHCKEVRIPLYDRELCDDGSGTAKWCTVESGARTEYRCPPGGPPGVTPDGAAIVHTAEERKAMDATSQDYARNRECTDVAMLRR